MITFVAIILLNLIFFGFSFFDKTPTVVNSFSAIAILAYVLVALSSYKDCFQSNNLTSDIFYGISIVVFAISQPFWYTEMNSLYIASNQTLQYLIPLLVTIVAPLTVTMMPLFSIKYKATYNNVKERNFKLDLNANNVFVPLLFIFIWMVSVPATAQGVGDIQSMAHGHCGAQGVIFTHIYTAAENNVNHAVIEKDSKCAIADTIITDAHPVNHPSIDLTFENGVLTGESTWHNAARITQTVWGHAADAFSGVIYPIIFFAFFTIILRNLYL